MMGLSITDIEIIERELDIKLDNYRLISVIMLRDACDRWMQRHGYEE